MKYYTATLRLHYVENGNWLDIDNSINNLNANFFARQGSDMEVYFSKGETQTEFRIGQEWIRLSLSGLTIWEDEQILDQFSSQSPLVTVVDSLLRYSDNIPYHDLTYCVFNDRVRWQVVISNDILNTYSTVTDFEYEFEIEYSAGLDFSPAIISYHLPGSNIPVHFYSDSLVYASISQWLVRNEQGIISVDDIEFTPLSGKRFRVNCRMNADHILNNFPSDSTIIEAVLFQLAVREQNPQSSVNDYYTADRIHNGAVVEWTWGSLTNYDWSFLPWVGHYDDYSYGSNEKYRAYFYWELDGIPSVSTIEQVDYFKVEVVNKAEGPNPSSCLTINTRNLIFDENNLSNYEALYNAIDDG
ncbi:MAG: hypothetical protein GWN00_15025, partial [Aliifodinibius sp.]|nr:hypothetical protein [Fodinibius sp.]NIV12403.1 hypothetical protein [Fodinibius sp.]NIY26067.1 hypothetical protein [Fodinibius sp.]